MVEKKVARFSSCRGVAFEITPNQNSPFAIPDPAPPPTEDAPNGWVWLPWTQRSSFKVFPSSGSLRGSLRGGSLRGSLARTLSKPSSHFCDLDPEELEDDEYNSMVFIDEEEGEEEERDVEKQKIADIPVTKQEPPAKPAQPRPSRLSVILLDQGLFTVYKRLFVVVLTINLLMLILAATGNFQYGKDKAALFSIANILALSLCRSEALLRVVFWLAVKILGRSWMPLGIRTSTTSFLQCLGGVHSGCGVSSIAWLIYALVLTVKDKENSSPEIIGVASIILSLIMISSLAAFPLVRHLHHNVFERTHRFAGWGSLVLVWVFVILTTCYESKSKTYDLTFSKLAKAQEFWFTIAITIIIILPWVTVRRVPVRVSAPSGHASIIKFEGGIESGILGRISPSPFSEWHAFGIISDNKDEHFMLAGAVGDFTKSLVSDPPTHLWVRSLHFAGLPYLTNMYERVVLVATGSGICVFLSFLLQPCRADVCLVWVCKGVEQNFGTEIKEKISGFPKDKVIVHDTVVLGRPNVAQLSVDTAKRWNAQVVIVTSNPEGSRDVVDACKASGIAAFGPTWDS